MTSNNFQVVLTRITERKDVLLAALLVAIIFMMILPLPTELVDVLIGTSMAISVILLMLAVYIGSAGEFFAFPAVLLLTTLFRLALSITTTRLVLLQADAGRIVETFGNFVVAGNLVVGLVIFLIITIVQFLVVTKGAERVAEVSARFSLDAMPGKQMSIDGDMRAGVIDLHEARKRREKVEKESQLYGSMDGAMKFVKGDAIAGLIIIVINIIGGLSVGVLQRNMDVAEAIHVYSILTIGDGLVAQIPALLIAMTSGIIVTRVSTEETQNLASDISGQVTAQPMALLVAAGLMLALALVPGFPKLTFVVLAAITGVGGAMLLRGRKKREAQSADQNYDALLPAAGKSDESNVQDVAAQLSGQEEITLSAPLLVDMAVDLRGHVSLPSLNVEVLKVRRALYLDLGVPFPGIHLRFNENINTAGDYAILMQEVPVANGNLQPGQLFYTGNTEELSTLGIHGESGEAFLPNLSTLWIPEDKRDQLQGLNLSYLDTPGVLCYHLAHVLKRYADEFIGIQEVNYLFGQLEGTYPDLLKEVQRLLPIHLTTEVLQRLVNEDISIRNIRLVLESLVEWGQKEKDPVQLTEYVRSSLRRYISYKYANEQNILSAYLLDQELEETIRGGIRQTSTGNFVVLEPEVTRKIVEEASEAVGDITRHRHKPVLVTAVDIRRYVRKMLEIELYDLAVLSFQELTQEISVQPIGRLSI